MSAPESRVTVQTEPADLAWHGAVLPMEVSQVTIGPALGSQTDRGVVAHVTFHTGSKTGFGYGCTVDDPYLLAAAADTLREAAERLREARA